MGRGTVGEDDVQLFDVVQGFAVDDRVGAAGVVADAAADAGAVGRGGVGGVLQAVGGHLAGQLLQDDAGLHPRPLLFGVDFQHIVEVLAEVQHDGVVHGLAGQAGAAGAGQHRDAFPGAKVHHGLHIGRAAGDDDAHRLHLVDAGVGAVKQAGVGVKAHFAGHPAA